MLTYLRPFRFSKALASLGQRLERTGETYGIVFDPKNTSEAVRVTQCRKNRCEISDTHSWITKLKALDRLLGDTGTLRKIRSRKTPRKPCPLDVSAKFDQGSPCAQVRHNESHTTYKCNLQAV